MKKKITINKKKLSYAAILAGSIFASTALVTTQSIFTKNVNNSSNSATKESGESFSDSKQTEESKAFAQVRSNSNFSKQIPVSMQYENSPIPTVNSEVSFSDGNGKSVISFIPDSNGNVIAKVNPNTKVFVTTTGASNSISSDDYDISIKTYTSSGYSFTDDGFTQNNLISEVHLPYTIQQSSIGNPFKGEQDNYYVTFEPTGNEGKIVGNMNSGYVEVTVKIRNTHGYYGTHILDASEGHPYSANLASNKQTGDLHCSFVFTNLSGEPSVIYNNNVASNSSYEPDLVWLAASDSITASSFLSTKIDHIPVVAKNIYANQSIINDPSQPLDPRNTPTIYGFADDINGELNIVMIPPNTLTADDYTITSNVRVNPIKPLLFTFRGFKKVEESTKENTKIINSSSISIHNSTSSNNFVSKGSQYGYHTGFGLSPLSLFNIKIQNGVITIEPNQEKLNGTQFIDGVFNDNDLLDWYLVDNSVPYATHYNAESFYKDNFAGQMNNMLFENTQAVLQSFVNGMTSVNSTPISNLFTEYNDVNYGPWVSKESGTDWGFLNYLYLLRETGSQDIIQSKFTQSFSLGALSDQNKIIQFKNLWGAPLPKLLVPSGDKAEDSKIYMDNFAEFADSTIKKSGSDVFEKKDPSKRTIYQDNFLSFENGPTIMLRANPSSTEWSEPYLIDNSSIYAWNDLTGVSHFSVEAINIFSSEENYNFNVNELGFSSENFGKTIIKPAAENCGVTNNNTILPSQFINDASALKNIQLNAYNSPLSNIDNSQIKLIANDNEGTITVEVKPFVVANINDQFFSYGVSSLTDFEYLSSSQIANLFDVDVTTNNDLTYTYVIKGFKKNSNNEIDLEQNYFNPSTIYMQSSIDGTDIEANLERFKKSDDKALFKEWIIANAIAQSEYKYFDPETGTPMPKLFKTEEKYSGMFIDFDHDVFEKVIDSWSLVRAEKYNLYQFDVWFKPFATYNIYNNVNANTQKLTITIDTTGKKYGNWNVVDNINPLLMDNTEEFVFNGVKKTVKAAIEAGDIDSTVYMNNFIALLTAKDLGTFTINGKSSKINIWRYWESGKLFDVDELNSEKTYSVVNKNSEYSIKISRNILNFSMSITIEDLKTHKIYPYPLISPRYVVQNFKNAYGDLYSPTGKFEGIDYAKNILDFSNWDFKLDQIEDTGFIIKAKPKFIVKNSKVVEATEAYKIKIVNVVPESRKTKLLSNNIQALDSSVDVFKTKEEINTHASNKYLDRIKSLVQNASDKTKIEIEVDQQDFNKNIEMYANEGSVRVSVYASGEWFNGKPSATPIPDGKKELLGYVTIVGLQKSKVTTIVDSLTIPSADLATLPHLIAQGYWSDLVTSAAVGSYKEFKSDFATYLKTKVFNYGIDGTKILFKANDINKSNVFFDNNEGTLTLKSGKYLIGGSYTGFEYVDGNVVGVKEITNNPKVVDHDLVIKGFKKVRGITKFAGEAASAGTYTIDVPSLAGTSLEDLDAEALKREIVNKNIFVNLPNYDNKATEFIDIKGGKLQKDFNTGTVTFEFELLRQTVDTIKDHSGDSVNAVATKGNVEGYGAVEKNMKGKMVLSGFNPIKLRTKASESGGILYKIDTTAEFANTKYATDFVGTDLVPNKQYKYNENAKVKEIIDIILKLNLIENIPSDATPDTISISISSIDNSLGAINLDVFSTYCYVDKNADGIITLHKDATKPLSIGTTVIYGFKKTPASATDTKNKRILLSSSTTVNTSNNAELVELVRDNYYSIFKNGLDVVELAIDEIVVKDVREVNPNEFECSVELKKVYEEDPVWRTLVVSKTPKTFTGITFTGFNNPTNKVATEILDEITMKSSNKLTSLLASDVYNNQVYRQTLEQLIFDQAIRGSLPPGISVTNVAVTSFNDFSNIRGYITVSVSLDKYILSDGTESNNTTLPLLKDVKIYGFQVAKETIIDSFYNGINNPNIKDKIASEFTEGDIIDIIYEFMIHNTTNSFVKGDISIKPNSVYYDNLNGSITFTPVIKNYYTSTGNISKTRADFPITRISGFKKVKSMTLVPSHIDLEDKGDELAALFLKGSKNNADLKKLIAKHIIGLPNEKVFDPITDIVINNTQIDNYEGTIKAKIQLKKMIADNGSIIENPQEIFTITIGGFGNFGPTTLPDSMSWSNLGLKVSSGQTPYLYWKQTTSKNEVSKAILDNIENKWNGFNEGSIKIANVKPNNIAGTLSVDVGFYEYVDSNGLYNVVQSTTKPFIKKFTITGFETIPQSEIVTTGVMAKKQDILASDYLFTTGVDAEIKQFVFDNLLVNKLSTTSINDIKILRKEYNNRYGLLLLDIAWDNNFTDETGVQVASPSARPIKARVSLSGFKSLNSGTWIPPSIDIEKEDTLASDFALETNGHSREILDMVFDKIENKPIQLTKDDVTVGEITLEDGNEYFGIVDNYEGSLTVKLTLNKFFDNNVEYHTNADAPALVISTKIKGFNKVTTPPTTIEEEIDIKNPTFDGSVYETFREIPAKDVVSTPLLNNLIIDSKIIKNWENLDGDRNNLLNMVHTQVVGSSGNTVNVQVRLKNTTSIKGLKINEWSSPYTIVIKGFKEIAATNVSASVSLEGQTSPILTNYEKGTSYSSINVWDLDDKDIKYITQNILNQIVTNQTSVISDIASAPNFALTNFDDYIKVKITKRDGLNGIINIQLSLFSFFDATGLLRESTTGDSSAISLTKNIIISGFSRTKVTKINKFARIKNPASPSDFVLEPTSIKNLIDQNKGVIFQNLPIDFNTNSIKYEVVSFDNTVGSLTLSLTLTNYFNEVGELIKNSGAGLTQQVTITGMKKTNETTMRRTLNLWNDFKRHASLIDINSSESGLTNILKSQMISGQNSATDGNAVFWKNLPMETIAPNDFTISFDENSYNFSNGTATMIIQLNRYYDEKGVFKDVSTGIGVEPKKFNVLVTGFDTVSEITEANPIVDVSEYQLSYGTANDVADLDTTGIKGKTNSSLLNKMFNSLPSNADYMQDISSITPIRSTANQKDGSIDVIVTLSNLFEYDRLGTSIIHSQSPKEFTIKLVGLSKVDTTSVVDTFDVSEIPQLANTDISDYPYSGGESALITTLQSQQVIKQIIKNPVSSGFTTTGSIKTSIVNDSFRILGGDPSEEQYRKSLKDGTLWVEFNIQDYYNEERQHIESTNPEPFKLKLTGFAKSSATTIKTTNVVLKRDEWGKDITASSFVGNSPEAARNNVIKILSDSHVFYPELTGLPESMTPQIVDVVSVNTTDVNDRKYDFLINDNKGTMKFKAVYRNFYNDEGEIDRNEQLSGIFTLSNFQKRDETTWKDGVKVSSYTTPNDEQIDLITVNLANDFYDLQVSQWDGKFTQGKTVTSIIMDHLNPHGSEGLIISEDVQNWIRDEKRGTVTAQISINNWQQRTNYDIDSESDPNYKIGIAPGSVLVESETKTLALRIEGFKKVDLESVESTRSSLAVIVGVLGGLMLVLIVALIILKRKFS